MISCLLPEICPQNDILKNGWCTYEKIGASEEWRRSCSCEVGFNVVGDSIATCDQSADWSNALPTCIGIHKCTSLLCLTNDMKLVLQPVLIYPVLTMVLL